MGIKSKKSEHMYVYNWFTLLYSNLTLWINSACVCLCVLSHVQCFETPWTISCQAPLSLEFSKQEY